jgi:hypothetical protein
VKREGGGRKVRVRYVMLRGRDGKSKGRNGKKKWEVKG